MGLHGAPRITIESCVARARTQGEERGEKKEGKMQAISTRATGPRSREEGESGGLRAAFDARLRTGIHKGSFIISSQTDDLSVGPVTDSAAVPLPKTICPYQRTKTAEIK